MKEDEDEKKEATGESSLGTKTLRNAQCLSSEGDHYVSSSWQWHDLMTLKQNVKHLSASMSSWTASYATTKFKAFFRFN